ncbi:MAG TPA: class I SAM-dependent DNA methyltransferase [Baekduia sp.]|nr:class I SAM-dependent DNA methyltransferase [Baekduia sp.]
MLTQKLWSYCKVLRDDGLTYGDYLEQLTYLLFLKMAHERTQPPRIEPSRIPAGYDWPSLEGKKGVELETHYTAVLQHLAQEPGLLGLIFRKAQNRIQDPAKLKHLISNLIGKETWSGLDADLAGDFYEDLLERTAAEGKAGAGQYFTPRSVIRAMVDCLQPKPGQTMSDPACGTGGFLLAFYEYVLINHELDRDEKLFLRDDALHGNELVDNTARLCAMNLFLHGIGHLNGGNQSVITVGDALIAEPDRKVDIVLANPPFGSKSAVKLDADVEIDEEGNLVEKPARSEELIISRPDFWASTSNKQFNFVQHIRSMLKIGGQGAVVVPDNVLFEGQSPNSAGARIRERLLQECDVHTILRLPTGIFYAQGVNANVIFFRRLGAQSSGAATKEIWVYDFRTNQHFTLKTKPLRREHLDDFVEAYKPGAYNDREESERFRRYTYEEIAERPGFNLDLPAYVKDEKIDDPSKLPAPEVIAEEIELQLQTALTGLRELLVSLQVAKGVDPEDIPELEPEVA